MNEPIKKTNHAFSRLFRNVAASWLSSLVITGQTLPCMAITPNVPEKVKSAPASAAAIAPLPKGGIKTGARTVNHFEPALTLSDNPTDLEISTARIFLEPLTAMPTEKVAGENAALARALKQFKTRAPYDVQDLVKFADDNPSSRWRLSVQANIADAYFRTGYLSRAIALWSSIWDESKDAGEGATSIANHAIGNLLLVNARLGRRTELEKYFAQIEKRSIFGSDELKANSAKQGLLEMQANPGRAYKCGPYAISSLLYLGTKEKGNHPLLEKAASTSRGTNLAQVKGWADQVGLKYQIAKRSKGAEVIAPSVMHWSVEHFAAITEAKNGKYHVKDPTFDHDGNLWVEAAALDAETDGYFLIPATASLPAGWQAVSEDEAKNVWGKGGSEQSCQECKGCDSPTSGEDSCTRPTACKLMAKAAVYSMQATLTIADNPLYYTPPVGPAIDFVAVYDHLEANQPTTFTFTNLGQNWNFQWLSYLTVDPLTSVAVLRKMGGGSETFTPDPISGLYTPDLMSQATLVLISPGVYERRMPDGSKQVYNQADGSSPARIFMTQAVDKTGNAALVQYDANFRITTVQDAIGQISTINYVSNTLGNAGFYKIASIVSPFGTTCTFGWDSTTTLLLSITDCVGMKSEFLYDTTSSFITSLKTPYGTTSFYQYIPAYTGPYPAQGLRIRYPDGTSEVIESYLSTNQASYYWDRHATQLYPADPANQVYTHCEKMKWVMDFASRVEKPVMQYAIHPLESASPIYYRSQGQGASADFAGTTNQITQTQRALGNAITVATVNGTITAGDIFYISADGQGGFYYTVQPSETASTLAANLVATTNANASMQAAGVSAVQASPTTFSLYTSNPSVAQFKFYPNPGITTNVQFRSQTKQTAAVTIGGTMTVGDTVNLDIALPHPNNFSERITHNVVGGDSPTIVAADIASKINANALLAISPTTATASGPVVYISSYSPRVVSYGPFIGGANTETIVVSDVRNGSVQLSTNEFNSLGKLTKSVDALNRTFSYVYDSNNIDLLQKKETQGSNNYQIGAWTWNAHHQPLTITDGSGRVTQISYNSLQQPIAITDADSNVTTLTYTGTSSATIGGTATAGNVLTITVHDPGLPGGLKAASYTVVSGNTLTNIATGLRNAINADANLQAIGVTATSSAAVITLKSTSVNAPTTYTKSTSGGATGTITLGANTFGYLTKIDGPLAGSQDVTTFSYDGYGRLFTETNSENYTLQYSYDSANRLTRTTLPDATFEQTIWDRLDQVMLKDRNGRWTQIAFDSMDQLAYEIDPLGRKTQYTWCSCGSILTLTDPANHTTAWHHDLQGRTTQKVYADSSTVNFSYDPFGSNLMLRTDALNQKTHYLYYPDDRAYQTSYTNAVNPTAAVTTVWDANYERITSLTKNDWGTISYTFNPYIMPAGSPTTGGGRLQLIHNDRMANSDITFVYDNLGRVTNRSINGSANSDSFTFDAMSRVTSETNALGTFNYAYVDNVSGSSKGSPRLASVTYPNNQVTRYSWYPTNGDLRLQQIANLKTSGGPTISQFSYRYDPAGQITQWQQIQNNRSKNLTLGYDEASQLTSSQTSAGGPSPAYLGQEYFAYDAASNRTAVQQSKVTRVKLNGTATTGNTLTITVKDSGLTGGQTLVPYTLVGGDTLSTAATKLAAAITSDATLLALGVNAFADGATISIKSASPNITTYEQSTSGGATATIALDVTSNFVENIVIGGTKTTGNVLTLTVMDPALSGGLTAISYTVLSGDTLATMTTGLKNAINANAGLAAAGISATSVGTIITVRSTSPNATTYSSSLSAGATATMALSINQNGPQTIAIAGTKTTGDVLTVTVYDTALAGGLRAVNYTTLAGDTIASIATGLASALNADANLQGAGISATVSGAVITLRSNSVNQTLLRASTSASATEIIAINIPANGVQTAVIGGTKTTGDLLTITVYDASLPTGSESVSYTVLSSDDLSTIAAGLASALNANSSLSNNQISATSSSSVLNVKSNSLNLTTYIGSVSGGATESVAFGLTSSLGGASYNSVNALTNVVTGGEGKFSGLANKALKFASAASSPGQFDWSQSYRAKTNLTSGANNISVSITDGANNVKANSYQLSIGGPATSAPTFNTVGNLTQDGGKTYYWDAENRLSRLTYPGAGNSSSFLYDPLGRLTQVVELVNGTIIGTKQYLWSDNDDDDDLCEERDSIGTGIKRFFEAGLQVSSSNYYYAFDHLDSIREITDGSQIVVSEMEYTSFGQLLPRLQAIQSDFNFCGMLFHGRSDLNLTLYRAYLANKGRWASRDPVEELEGPNLYAYVKNDPVNYFDEYGLGRRTPRGNGSGSKARPKSNSYCRKISCCINERDICADKCGIHFALQGTLALLNAGKAIPVSQANACRACCTERRTVCMAQTSRGRPYNKKNFNCHDQCYE